jgi:ATP-dependent helicase Lhr and Lhr-like helicase
VTNPGHDPRPGLYSVNILEDGRRVGELDEEMAFESRPGKTLPGRPARR